MNLFKNVTKEDFEWFLNLLRPKFYNRMTLWVVGLGVALLSTPYWADPLAVWLSNKTNLLLTIPK